MTTIATTELQKIDVPDGKFTWSAFSKYALTFDPFSEASDVFNQVLASATPSDTWTKAELRYFLYCWQRTGNNQGGLTHRAIEQVKLAMNILRAKL